jgi:hypothetical protein
MQRVRRSLIAASVAVAVIAAPSSVATGGQAHGAGLPHGGAILAATDQGLYLVNADGTASTWLTRDRFDNDPVLSPEFVKDAREARLLSPGGNVSHHHQSVVLRVEDEPCHLGIGYRASRLLCSSGSFGSSISKAGSHSY